jgi:hypothetical protein
VMGKHGVIPARADMFGPGGSAQLDALEYCRAGLVQSFVYLVQCPYGDDVGERSTGTAVRGGGSGAP